MCLHLYGVKKRGLAAIGPTVTEMALLRCIVVLEENKLIKLRYRLHGRQNKVKPIKPTDYVTARI
jgi:hypothetical protein